MKRIALLACGMLLLAANAAEARWRYTQTSGGNYRQQVQYAPATYNTYQPATHTAYYPTTYNTYQPATYATYQTQSVQATSAAYHSTATAQGVASIMASYNRVGHWGGNPGYEGCGAGATPAAAYNNCCFANSGMATVDVGYAQSASGMWYCCRRYR